MTQPRSSPFFEQLIWTLAAMLVSTAPHIQHLPSWPILAAGIAALWRVLAERRGWRLPGMVLRLVLAVAGFFVVFVAYRTINGVDAGTALLIIMMAMKLTETRAQRDLVVLLYISFFLIVANFLYDQTMWAAAYAVPCIWLTTTALLQVARNTRPEPAVAAARSSGILLLQALPVMLVFFVLFPRVPGPFWALPTSESKGRTGLGSEMSPGSITELLRSNEVAFRVTFNGTPPPPEQRYWRGPVMRDFDGARWKIVPSTPLPAGELAPSGVPYDYDIVLEPHQKRWLFALDMPDPARLPGMATISNDYQVTSRQKISQIATYRMRSWTSYYAGAGVPAWRLDGYRSLPARNPRAFALARSWRDDGDDDRQVVQRALSMFREQPFVYTLRPPPLNVRGNPVDQFLFGTQRGFCEHYASAFTVLMRAAGIPARVVTGYQGGEANPFGKHLTVRQSDAHAWSEVWLDSSGWTRVDPVSAVAPDRIEMGLAQSLPDGESLPGRFLSDNALFERIRFGVDAINTRWNEWVLGYGKETQIEFLSWLGLRSPSIQKMLLAMTFIIVTMLVALSLWLAWKARPVNRDRTVRIYRRFCSKLARRDIVCRAGEGPQDFSDRAAALLPDLAGEIRAITARYIGLRYLGDDAGTGLRDFGRAVAAFKT